MVFPDVMAQIVQFGHMALRGPDAKQFPIALPHGLGVFRLHVVTVLPVERAMHGDGAGIREQSRHGQAVHGRGIRPGELGKRGEDVPHGPRVVADLPGRYVARPPCDHRYADAAFVQVPLDTPERAVGFEVPGVCSAFVVRAVVAGEEYDGILAQAQFLDPVQNAPDVPVEAGDHGGVRGVRRRLAPVRPDDPAAREGRIRQKAAAPVFIPEWSNVLLRNKQLRVHEGKRQVQEERLVLVRLDEIEGSLHEEIMGVLCRIHVDALRAAVLYGEQVIRVVGMRMDVPQISEGKRRSPVGAANRILRFRPDPTCRTCP